MTRRSQMPSDGRDAAAYLRVVRVNMDALGVSLAEALASVPEEMRDAVRALWEEEHSLPIRRAAVLSGLASRREWAEDWNPSSGYYWRNLRSYMLDGMGIDTGVDISRLLEAGQYICDFLQRQPASRVARALSG